MDTDRVTRYLRALTGRRLPVAFVDLDAVDANVDQLVAAPRARGKTVRLATKSVRCPWLVDYIVRRGGDAMRGLMAFTVDEAATLVELGHHDVLVAYPSVQPADARALAELNRRDGVTVSIVVDDEAQLDRLAAAADGVDIPVVVEVDMALRPLGGRVHLGVRRSPLHDAADVVRVARAARARPGLRFAGVMGYEAQIAGIGERNPFSRALNPVKAAMKWASVPAVRDRRREVAGALARDGFALDLFNGGGTGSLDTTTDEDAITEVTIGSGFLCSHLFDYYPNLSLTPAAFFALQVVRIPGPGYATVHGGGWIASGEPGRDRLPLPVYPPGLELTGMEAAGEVQTPLHGPGTANLAIGDPVVFRHAKAGELAEHITHYVLLRNDAIVDEVPTYRGLGKAFL